MHRSARNKWGRASRREQFTYIFSMFFAQVRIFFQRRFFVSILHFLICKKKENFLSLPLVKVGLCIRFYKNGVQAVQYLDEFERQEIA